MLVDKEKQKYTYVQSIISSFGKEMTSARTKKKKNREKKEIYKRYLKEFYDALTKLPYPFQHSVAQAWEQAVIAAEKKGLDTGSCDYDDEEQLAFEHIKRASEEDADFSYDIDRIRAGIASDREEIVSILSSRGFWTVRHFLPEDYKTGLDVYKRYVKLSEVEKCHRNPFF